MQCIRCRCYDSWVVQVYKHDLKNLIERRRQCAKCGNRFTTQEKIKEPRVLKKTKEEAA